MMKKWSFVAVLVAAVFVCSTAAAATSDELLAGMGKKFVRGVVNLLTGWVELPMQVVKGFQGKIPSCGDNQVMGTVCGVFKGVGHAIGRTAWGGLELVGFWAANPEDNEGIGIPLDAQYAWEDGEPYDCLDPSFSEATLKPMGKKLVRGLGNGLLGVVEVPGQIAKGISGGAPDLGIIKGLWYWCSREVYGIGELVSAIFPNPVDNPGLAFDEEYPWDALTGVLEE